MTPDEPLDQPHATQDIVRRLTVENVTDRPATFILEPWGCEYPIAPGQRLVVEQLGPPQDEDLWLVPAEQSWGDIVVWAGLKSNARILREDGSVVVDW
jgi:hypothetical protein